MKCEKDYLEGLNKYNICYFVGFVKNFKTLSFEVFLVDKIDNSLNNDLSKIAGSSAEIGFTRLSLTSDELKPFDYLKFDTKQICNVLGWSDKLLNSDEGAKYDNIGYARRMAITDNIQPDLKLLANALNTQFLPYFF